MYAPVVAFGDLRERDNKISCKYEEEITNGINRYELRYAQDKIHIKSDSRKEHQAQKYIPHPQQPMH